MAFTYKYIGTEKHFRDPYSPYNDVATVELERMLRQQELKEKASKALNSISPEARKVLQEQLAPKQDTLVPEPVEPDKPEFLDSYPWEGMANGSQ